MKIWTAIVVISYVGYTVCDCVWDINKDLSEKEPLFLKKHRKNYLLYYPNSTKLELKPHQSLTVACPGNKNSLEDTNKSYVKIACEGDTKVKVDGQIRDIKNISCAKNVAADVLPTNKSDSIPGSSILNIGYHTSLGWLTLFNVSYDFHENTPLYATHVIHGKGIKGTFVGNKRPSFKANGVSSKIAWSKIYTKNHQKEKFEQLFGASTANYFLNTSYLSRGHLAPDADFHFHSWEMATYFYANVVPQWQNINVGNWLRIENSVRSKAKETSQDLLVFTGTEGVLELDNDNKKHRIYLEDNNQVPVPKYIWKIVCDKSNDCITLVVVNNPFAETESNICRNLCDRNSNIANWHLSSFDDNSKGRVFCCDVRDIRNTFKNIPPLLVNGVLRY